MAEWPTTSVTSAEIVDGSIVDADVAAGAAIQVSKLSGVETPAGAQTKADAAQAAAEATAASDATTKANAAQSAAESTSAAALTAHEADTTSVHGIADTTALETTTGAQTKADAAQAAAEATAASALTAHNALTDTAHGLPDTSTLIVEGDARLQVPRTFSVEKPSGLGWDDGSYPLGAVSISVGMHGGRTVAAVGTSAVELFDAVSAARTAPTTTYYVNGQTGNDANAGTSAGAPVKSIWKAISLANATGQPARIYVAAGRYERANNPWYNSSAGISPTVDTALIATGGRVMAGTWDYYATPSRHGTYTNTFTMSFANVQRVLDRISRDRFGHMPEFTAEATPALCNAHPWSYCLSSGTLYVHRGDGRDVTYDNTMVLRPNTKTLLVTSNVNVYLGGEDASCGFDLVGGMNGAIDVYVASTPAAKVLAVENCRFTHGGGVVQTDGRAVSVNSWRGLAVFENCHAGAGMTDGFNFHNGYGALDMHVLTMNCTSRDNGRYGNKSCNGWTSHEDVVGIDLGGAHENAHGGTYRMIGTSKTWIAGGVAHDDQGDVAFAGSVSPTGFRVDDTAEAWTDRCTVSGPAASIGWHAASAGASIHKRDCTAFSTADIAVGTVDTY